MTLLGLLLAVGRCVSHIIACGQLLDMGKSLRDHLAQLGLLGFVGSRIVPLAYTFL